MNGAIKTVGKVYVNIAVKKLSVGVVLDKLDDKVAEAMGECKFSAAERQSGLWAEFHAKAEVSLKAQIVAMAFMNEFHSI